MSKWGVKETVRSMITQANKPKEVEMENFSFETTEIVTISTPNWNSDLAHSNYIEENDSYLIPLNLANTNDTFDAEEQDPLSLEDADEGVADINIVIKDECYKSFKNEDDIEQQEMNETNQINPFDKYNCSAENRDVSSSVSIQLTEEATSQARDNEKPFKCVTCSKCFVFERNFIDHKMLHIEERLYYCSMCGKSFTRKDHLKKHKLTHTRIKGHKCSECGKSFARIDDLKKHELIHTRKKPHKCSECGRGFATPDQLKKHMLVHSKQKRFMCQLCKKRFWQEFSLKNHSKRCPLLGENRIDAPTPEQKPYEHNGEANIISIIIKEESYNSFINENIECQEMNHMNAFEKCGVENRDAGIPSSVSVQLIEEAPKPDQLNDKPFKCETCSKCFTFENSLIDHKKLHTGVYYCSMCGKSFTGIDDLKKHKLTHTRKKGYKCSECEKSFARIEQLTNHELTHTGEKPHKCSQCGKCFASLQYLLTEHKQIHQRRYKCKFCRKTFWQHLFLKNHLNGCKKIYTGENLIQAPNVIPAEEKPFLCKFCEKEFENSSTLTDHERTHRGKRRYKCVTCGKQFINRGMLKMHKNQSHKTV